MKIAANYRRCLAKGFTLVELLTAMAITAVLVFVIIQLTNQGISLWKNLREDTDTATTARTAMQTITRDLESVQLRSGSKGVQWMYAEVDAAMRGLPRGLSIPRSARLIFYACPPDRNPPVDESPSQREHYRNMVATNPDTQGDVSAVSYRLKFRDHILNLANRKGDVESFPLFSLYRQVVPPRKTYDNILGSDDLRNAYGQFESKEDKHFLCENIVELSIIFNIEYIDAAASAGGDSKQVRYSTVSIPILSGTARNSKRRFLLYGDYADTEGKRLENARVVSAELSITVLTEEGVALVQQVRLGQRHAPKLEEFFSKYTRSYSRSVSVPQPL